MSSGKQMDWDEAMRRSEFRWTPGGLVQILVGVPHWESHRPRKATTRLRRNLAWTQQNLQRFMCMAERKGEKCQRGCSGLQKRGPHPSIHPSNIPPTVYSQTDIDKSGKYGPPPPRCGQKQGRLWTPSSSCLQRHYSKGKRLLQLRLLFSLFLQFWVEVVGVSTGTQFMPARSGCSHARGRIRLTD